MTARTRWRLRIRNQKSTAANASNAPRDDDASMPITAVKGSSVNTASLTLVQYRRRASMKHTEMGKNIAMAIPNSPEFWNQPGTPTTPQSRNANPIAAHDRVAWSDIFRL